jgi:adenine-specific DNA-methyltransferase
MSQDQQPDPHPIEAVSSPDHNAERLATLKTLFPDLFSNEGKLNIDELKKVVDPALVSETERYDFRWYGKTQSKREAFTPSRASLVYDKDRSVNLEKAKGNMIIEGENLEVLKLLTCAYRERIKCIYIDPPYNLGEDRIYSDDYSEERKPYWEQTGVTQGGVKVDTNTEADGRFHSRWLSSLHSRLLVSRLLLSHDGVIMVSIDDNELQNLLRLLDEVFGEENFIGIICWRNVTDNNPTLINKDNEFIVTYARNKEKLPDAWKSNLSDARDALQREYERLARQKLPIATIQEQLRDFIDDNAEILYNLTRYKNVDEHGVFTGSESVHNPKPGGYDFEVFHPDTNKPMRKPANGYRFPEATFREMEKQGLIIYGEDEKRIVKIKKYLSDFADTLRSTIVLDGRLGSYDLKRIFGDKHVVFRNPKPVELLKMLYSYVTDKDSVILDFYGGSGTTCQAILELNRQDGGTRTFILVQLPEEIDKDTGAYAAGFRQISDITIERSKRVVLGYGDTPKPFDSGFKVYTLAKSAFPRVAFAPDTTKTESENVDLLKQYIRDKETSFHLQFEKEKVLDEVLLKHGFMLDYAIKRCADFKSNEVFLAKDAHKEALVCLDAKIEPETVDHFQKHKDQFFICLELALDTTRKWNLKHSLADKLKAI